MSKNFQYGANPIGNQAAAYFAQGLAQQQSQQYPAALNSFAQAIALKPDHAEAHYNHGCTLLFLNRVEEAFSSFGRVLALQPNHLAACFNTGYILQQTGQLEQALALFEQVLTIRPDYLLAFINSGLVLKDLNRYEEALAKFAQASTLKPDYADAHNNCGLALYMLQRYEAALAKFDQVCTLRPNDGQAYNQSGLTLYKLKRYEEALARFERAIALRPDDAEVYNNSGLALYKLKQNEAALARFERATMLRPDDAEAYNNCGLALSMLKRNQEALVKFERALTLKADYADAFVNQAVVLNEQKRYVEALASCDQAISLSPAHAFLPGRRLHIKLQICDWRDIEAEFIELAAKIDNREKISIPLTTLVFVDDPALQRKAAEIWTAEHYPAMHTLPKISRYPLHSKIRVGYFSADFRNHPVAGLTAELFEIHDRSRFEITAFAFGPVTKDEMSIRLEAGFDRFLDVRNLSDTEVVQLARNLQIDIAVDLGGHTTDCRTGIFAMRAAPLQISYIGYVGTMGADYMDYLLADRVVIPETAKPHYLEKMVYLPSYQVNDRKRCLAENLFTRQQLGLPETGFVFCCFNVNHKIMPDTFSGWMRILNKVPDSVLFLSADNEFAQQNLKNAAVARGVAADRLVFGKRLPMPEYLARYRQADLFLDTLPYNAGTTASDALWAGLPVLTRIGESFAGRMAASLLNAIQLPELITTSQAEYEALAIELATQPEKLSAIKAKLEKNRLTTPLFDSQGFTRHLEAAYQLMYQRYQADLPADDIYL